MTWIAALGLVLQIALQIANAVRQKQSIDAGEAEAIATMLKDALERVQAAQIAGKAVRDDPASLLGDPNDIDNRKP